MDKADSHPYSSALQDVAIEIRVCVGRARPTVRALTGMAPETVLPLDSRIEDPVGLYVGEKLIAEGELVELDGDQAGQLGVRLTRLVDGGPIGG